jgi:hypothetical protein
MIDIVRHHFKEIGGAWLQPGYYRGGVGSHVHLIVEISSIGAGINQVTGDAQGGAGVPRQCDGLIRIRRRLWE